MDVILGMFGNLCGLLAGFGFVVAVGCGIWSGVQFMLAQGDPQKVAQARMGFVGVVVGLLMVGAAFVVPQVIQDEVVDRNIPIDIPTGSNSCDSTLQTQLKFQTAASTAERMRAVVRQIQLRGGDCASDIWNPIILDTDETSDSASTPQLVGPSGTLLKVADREAGCGKAKAVDGITVPATIRGGTTADSVRDNPGRDANGNIVVHFANAARPGDNAVCWLYVDALDTWLSSDTNP